MDEKSYVASMDARQGGVTVSAEAVKKACVDPEFRDLCPALSDDERKLLRQSLRDEGLRDEICLWGGVIIDGHHREELCVELGIERRYREIELGDRSAAFEWIVSNQLARRNLIPAQRIELVERGRDAMAREGRKKQGHGKTAPGKNAFIVCDKSVAEPHNTQATIAQMAGVSPNTVAKHDRVKKAVADGTVSASLVDEMLSGQKTIGGAYTEVRRAEKEQGRETKRAEDRSRVQAATEPEKLVGVYSTIVIDPPWDFGDEGDVDQFGRGRPDYATMSIEQIAALGTMAGLTRWCFRAKVARWRR